LQIAVEGQRHKEIEGEVPLNVIRKKGKT